MLDWSGISIEAIRGDLRDKNRDFLHKINDRQLIVFTNQNIFLCFVFGVKFVLAQILTSGKLRLKRTTIKFCNVLGLRKK